MDVLKLRGLDGGILQRLNPAMSADSMERRGVFSLLGTISGHSQAAYRIPHVD
jgi:hypothetical protein